MFHSEICGNGSPWGWLQRGPATGVHCHLWDSGHLDAHFQTSTNSGLDNHNNLGISLPRQRPKAIESTFSALLKIIRLLIAIQNSCPQWPRIDSLATKLLSHHAIPMPSQTFSVLDEKSNNLTLHPSFVCTIRQRSIPLSDNSCRGYFGSGFFVTPSKNGSRCCHLG